MIHTHETTSTNDELFHNVQPSAPSGTVEATVEPGLLSILMPVYNEEEFLGTIVDRALNAMLPHGLGREIIIVDDGSTDGSAAVADELARTRGDSVRVIHHSVNRGKGAAVRTAINYARGEFALIQDADLEYDPADYERLLRPLLARKADAVFGSRFMVTGERRALYYWHGVANGILTWLCNMLSDLNLTDMETCYKAFRTSLVKSIPLTSNRFGIEPELTIKVAKRKARVYETPISYHGRTYAEGKKIGLLDAFSAVAAIVRYSLSAAVYADAGHATLDALSVARKFNAWMADTIRPFVGERVLEIGAGIGNLTHTLVARKRLYVASDIDDEHIARLQGRFQHRPNVLVRKCDVRETEDFSTLTNEIDTVICLNVIEHIDNDLQALKNIHSVLAPGGMAVILVPQGQEIFGSLDIALGHYRRYSQDELRRKMEHAGFVVQEILSFNRISRPAWAISGRVLKRRVLSVRSMAIFDRLVWLWRKIDRLLPWPAVSIVAIGRKTSAHETSGRRCCSDELSVHFQSSPPEDRR
jgi:glycosyltransferase involved in cell wall biosynthesis